MSKLFAVLLVLAVGFCLGRIYEHHNPPGQEKAMPSPPGLIKEPMGVAPAVGVDGLTNAPWNQTPPPPKYKTLSGIAPNGLH